MSMSGGAGPCPAGTGEQLRDALAEDRLIGPGLLAAVFIER